MKKLSLDDLYNFYVNQNKSCNFSSSDTDSTIVVHVDENMIFESDYDPNAYKMPVHLKSCHILDNRNKSYISEDSMKEAIPSFYNCPILGYIHKLENGDYDFAGHEMFINDDGELEYKEIPVGVIPESCNAQLVYDKDKDKTYLEVDGYIYEDYTRAANILREKKESKVSVEIAVDQLSFDAETKLLNIEKFHFLGVTILGVTEGSEQVVEEGMYGSNITLADFSQENNSIVFSQNLIETLDKLNATLERFNIDTTRKEDADKLKKKFEEEVTTQIEEVTEETVEEVTETEEESEATPDDVVEETEVTESDFEESEESDTEESVEEETTTDEVIDENADEIEETTETIVTEAVDKKFSMTDGIRTVDFQISHEDIRYALYNLISQYDEIDNDWYMVDSVYDDYFVMRAWCTDAIYGQKYTVDGDNVSLDGERYKLYAEYLTESEKASLEEMRSNYSALKSELETYKRTELHSKLENILNAEEYSIIADTDEFKELKSTMDKYSVDELQTKADLLYAKFAKANFAVQSTVENKPHMILMSVGSTTEKEDAPYGGIFENFNK